MRLRSLPRGDDALTRERPIDADIFSAIMTRSRDAERDRCVAIVEQCRPYGRRQVQQD
jgi:hypothetical protein